MLILSHLSQSIRIQGNFDKGTEVLNSNFSEEFFADCGGPPQASLSIQDGEGLQEDFAFEDRPYLLVGRSMMCDIRLNHHDVSYRHAYFQVWDGEVFFIDLASRTGTFRDSVARHSGFFRLGNSLKIGPYTISNGEKPSSDDYKSSLLKQEIPKLPETTLEIKKSSSTSGKQKMRSFRRPVTLIGNSPSCKIRLEDDSVSRVHCSLVRTNQGLWVVDLLGKEGIKINGERTPFALLESGDELEVGKFHLVQRENKESALEAIDDSAQSEVQEDQAEAEVESQVPRKTISRNPRINPSIKGEEKTVAKENSVNLTVPAAPQQLNLSETFVLTLVEQFASMQRQIMDQSNQHAVMMSQLFTTMHQSQQELIRDDLQRVHEISMELERLQHEMMKEKSLTFLTESRRLEERDSEFSQASPIPPEHRSKASTEPYIEKFTQESSDVEEELEVPDDRAKTADAEQDPTLEPASAYQSETIEKTPKKNAEDIRRIREHKKEQTSAGINSHAWLTQRMSDLEKEKTTHWQKIMNVLSGK